MEIHPGLPKVYLPNRNNPLTYPSLLQTTVADTLPPFNLFEEAI